MKVAALLIAIAALIMSMTSILASRLCISAVANQSKRVEFMAKKIQQYHPQDR